MEEEVPLPEPDRSESPQNVDYHDQLKEASELLSQMEEVSEDSMPAYLAPYIRGLRSLANSRDLDGYFLFDRSDRSAVLKRLTKKEFKKLETEFGKQPNGMANMLELVQIYMRTVTVPKEDPLAKLSHVIVLMELFREITVKKKKPFVTWPEFSATIMNNYVEDSHGSEFGIANKYVYKSDALKRAVSPRVLAELRPEIVGKVETKVALFGPNHRLCDNQKHPNGIRTVKYMHAIDKILCLDQVSELFYVYDGNGKLWKKVRTSQKKHAQDTRILSIGWSEAEQRIGACIQDHSLSFWDWADNFEYEHTFELRPDESYVGIWYIEYCKSWITLDSDYIIHKWDIYQETSVKFPRVHTQIITDLVEVPTLPAVIASGLDKRIVVWDVRQGRAIATLGLSTVSAHTLVYSPTFEVMFSAGYEAEICMWTFAKSLDITLSRRMPGHNAQITALQIMDPQHILLSADEIGYIKSWDILTLTCIQSYYFESRVSLSKVITVSENRFIVVGNRFYFFEFEVAAPVAKKALVPSKTQAAALPPALSQKRNRNLEFAELTVVLTVEFSEKHKKLFIATSKDVRVYDMKLGKCLRVYSGMVSEEEEIARFALSSGQDQFIVGDTAGNVQWINTNDGLPSKSVPSTENILVLHIDPQSHLLLSIRRNQVSLGRDDGEGGPIREMRGGKCELDLATVSEYLNLVAASTKNGTIFFWDYCTFRLIGACDHKTSDVADLKFLEPFRILMSVHHTGAIVLWDISSTQGSCFAHFSPMCRLSFSSSFAPTAISVLPSELELIRGEDAAIIYLGSDEGVLAQARITEDALRSFVPGICPTKDCRKRSGYFAARVLKTELPTAGEEGNDEELEVAKVPACCIDKGTGFFRTSAHKEPINMLNATAMNGRCSVVTKGDSQTLKFWSVEEKAFELQAAINVEGAVPFVWKLDPQCETSRFKKLLKAAACLYQLDTKTGGTEFSTLVRSKHMSETFKTEVPEPERSPKKRPLLYGQLVQGKKAAPNKGGENNINEMLSFRQLDIRKSKLEDQEPIHVTQGRGKSSKRLEMTKHLLAGSVSVAALKKEPAIIREENDDDEDNPKDFGPPDLRADISKFKLDEDAKKQSAQKDRSHLTTKRGSTLLPVIKSVSTLKEARESQQYSLKRSKKNWIEYAHERGLPPLIGAMHAGTTKAGATTDGRPKQSIRKQLLARMLEKKKKSMVARYSYDFEGEHGSSKIASDSRAFVKELETVLKESRSDPELVSQF